ncbi:CHAT domain-containing protein [Microseira wollei]|uniref:CHAT domain-containing protein n=1 Tax=Microseira wollei NIES-4236 TaxID=2530354 RepID=A0AAV3XDM3_9CYAN|nr:CHAT domain-containing protein [Microseira wollei]GET38925.1 hypothetical protein MiSe_36850 [Microseira wollei NIES-4236]
MSQESPVIYAGECQRKHLATLKGEAEQLETQLARASAEFRTDQQPVTLEGIQALIPSNAALIEIVHYRPVDFKASLDRRFGAARYAAYILNASGTPEWVDLGDVEPIDTAARRFRQELNNPNNLKAARQRARELDALVMEPIRARLGNVEHLLISPDSQLNLVPFAALVDEQERYLIQTHKITYLTTGRDLRNLERSRPAQSPPLILADPNYDQPGSSRSTRAAQRSQDLSNLRFGPLPGAAAEAEALRGLLPNATLLTGDKATENAIKQTPAPEILHIATHGFFLADVEFALPRDGTRSATIIPTPTGNLSGSPARPSSTENPLLRSGLALAGFNVRASAGEDGVLTALEAAGLSLRGTRLVVMSACETGVGAVANGEGVYGLRPAFAIAGAESQLMSLWQVDDYSTAELMELYYSRILKGEERSEALRQVQLDLLAAPAYEHPYYWASFLFSGDWRPIKER